ncbi:MAG: PRC-barrel domain containing protein [Anaerolineae bacterium]|jgi:hypothetical protein
MHIPLSAKVYCAKELCGHTTEVILRPTTRQVTHIIVKEKGFPYMNRIVPIELAVESSDRPLHLRCTRGQLAALKPFLELEDIWDDVPHFTYDADEYRRWPYDTPEEMPIPAELERVFPDALVIRHDARVKATDGDVGRVCGFLTEPANGQIIHLTVREGHLWGQKDIAIPASEIDRIEEDTIHLKMDKRSLGALPAIPVRIRRALEEGT